MATDDDLVFKALADPTRRRLLDRLHDDDGQTLGQLCADLGMARQSATQHLDLLIAANLVSTVRRGRERLHYLNPVPLHDMQERWIDKFARPRLRSLQRIKHRAEDAMTKPTFQYVTYIEATPEAVWRALTDPDQTAEYWGHRNEYGDCTAGAAWRMVRPDGGNDVTGSVVEAEPPRRLVTTWDDPTGNPDNEPSTVTYTIESHDGIVRLSVLHVSGTVDVTPDVSKGWPAVLANLKTFLESGRAMPVAPWTVPAA